ncbi:MAG: hypothetical protein HPY65_06595 [Syntrophaceae bacterium]|nr:hypothetical protein [Syntrophaceae bacterium]
MKRLFRQVLILVSVMILFFGNLCLAGDWDVRPVKIKVIDAVTKQPLQGIKVYYVLTTRRPEMGCLYLFYPSFIHPPLMERKNLFKRVTLTDNNGLVFFDPKVVNLGCYERVFEEYITVNLDFDKNNPSIEGLNRDLYDYLAIWTFVLGDKAFSSNDHLYRGFFLTYVYKRDDHEEQLVKDSSYRDIYEVYRLKKLDTLRRPTVWDGKPEEYTVELRRGEK